ncbi:MAG TPA: hypothetical protein VEL76_16740 [Gemmataceae bacterium]|nr:hypothetical protein [Gemmataceae bacterium]
MWSSERKILTTTVFGLCGGLLLLGIVLWWSGALFGREPYNGPTFTVVKKKLKIAIIERGSLESAKNGDIYCTVRSGTKGSTNATTIRWLKDNGAEVTKGEKVMELDSSGLQEQLKDKTKEVDAAKAGAVNAELQCRIQKSQNRSDVEAAQNVLRLAEIDLEKYEEGDYVQALKDVEGRIEIARSDLDSWKDRAAWSARMVKKGLMSKVQADADKDRMEGSRIALQKVLEEKRVLSDFTRKRTVRDLIAKVVEAERALDRINIQTKAKLAQAEADLDSKTSIYKQEFARQKEIEAEIVKCTVLAPQDGLVVYFVPEQARSGGGSQQSIVAQGEPVREGQKMLQIPDLSRMQVSVRVHEAMVSHLHNEDPRDTSTWQYAQIRVEAFPTTVLTGHVKMVDNMASQQDWFSTDVKLYKTLVTIDRPIEGLKPGMSAEVTIFAKESETEVVVVPVQAVVGTITSGEKRKVFVVGTDGQPVLRDIVVGMSNQREVEVKSGLSENEKVVLNPRPLLGEGSEMRPAKVGGKNNEDFDAPGGEGGKKSKKGGGKKGPDGPGWKGGPPMPNGKGPAAGGKGPGGVGQGQTRLEPALTGKSEIRISKPETNPKFKQENADS